MKEIYASIITIGDELLIGQTIDTNSAFIAQSLNEIGIWLKRRIAVGDNRQDIIDALDTESKESRVIILTGGLGPTADDITKPVLCEYFGSSLVKNQEVENYIIEIFTKLNRLPGDRNLKQAEVPHNCKVLHNHRGTAPGMWFEKNKVIIISLPGVPHEMKGLMESGVIPLLKNIEGLPVVLHKTILTAGIGESVMADKLEEFESSLPSYIKLAYLPAYGEVKLRLTYKGSQKEKSGKELDEYFQTLKNEVKEWMVADEDILLEKVLLEMLKNETKTLATGESCTGGYIAHLMTSLPGSSKIFRGSVVAYSNDIKKELLNVNQSTLDKYGAVSEPTVIEMANGLFNNLQSDYVIATSGIMGPDGGSEEKPVGTVWVAAGSRNNLKTTRLFFRFDRKRNIELTARAALNFLRKTILEKEPNRD
jgi:nicotinamide-nucleotide amidase